MKNYSRQEFDQYSDRFPIAMAYVPWQQFAKMCDNPEEAFQNGTIFPELDKPFTGRRCAE